VDRVVRTPEDMAAFGRRLAKQLKVGDLVVLRGALGAGKTTLTQGIGEGLGVRGPVTSPTFVLARTHPSLRGGPPLVHVDAYRLASAMELDDLDVDFKNSIVTVEWGYGLLDAVADSWLEITIDSPAAPSNPQKVAEAEPRVIHVRGFGPRWANTAF
jgi:tRNA threonylcarbamoyladenosine biosynthesis protein TsaE